MSVAITPSIVLNNELNASGNGPISIYSSRKSLNSPDSDSDATIKDQLDVSFSPKPSSSTESSSTVQLNSLPSTVPTNVNRSSNINNGTSSNSKRSSHIQGPMAILTPCSNSHPFDERRINVTRDEEHAIKFGRAVARFTPAQNNAIFDCKVCLMFNWIGR